MTPAEGGGGVSRYIANSGSKDALGAQAKARFGRRLHELRGQRTLEDVARASGVAASSIWNLESGGSDPRLGTLLRLQKALGLRSIEEFLGDLPEPGELPSAVIARQLLPDEDVSEAS